MDGEVLLLNPRRRRKARRNPSPAQKRARAAFAAAARARSRASNPRRRRARRRNPVGAYTGAAGPTIRRRARRSNPIGAVRRSYRRRRNPISIGGIMPMIKETAVMGAGAVAMDIAYGYVAKYLPASMQAGPGTVSVGTIVKAGLTALAGKTLSRATNGMSVTAAKGSLVVQFRDLVAGLVPASMQTAAVAGRFGYASPAAVQNFSQRISPNRVGMGAFVPGSPSLSGRFGAFVPGSPSLSRGPGSSARIREKMIR